MPPAWEQKIKFWVGLIPYGSCQKFLLSKGDRKTAWFITYVFVMNGRGKNATRQFRWGIRKSFPIMRRVRHGNKLSRRVIESPSSEAYKGGLHQHLARTFWIYVILLQWKREGCDLLLRSSQLYMSKTERKKIKLCVSWDRPQLWGRCFRNITECGRH